MENLIISIALSSLPWDALVLAKSISLKNVKLYKTSIIKNTKIIFLTIAYDRTLYYISKEFFRYCFYLNANRVGSLSIKGHLTEDPAYQDEEYYQLISESKDNRFRKTLRRILNDLKYPESIIEHKCRLVASDQDLCEILVFDILPYYEDVLGHKPINASQQLQKYIERNLIHPHGRLIKRWFG